MILTAWFQVLLVDQEVPTLVSLISEALQDKKITVISGPSGAGEVVVAMITILPKFTWSPQMQREIVHAVRAARERVGIKDCVQVQFASNNRQLA